MHKLKRIVIILPTIITKNGTAKQSLELAKVLIGNKFSVSFLAFIYSPSTSFSEFKNMSVKYFVPLLVTNTLSKLFRLVLLEQIFLYIQCLMLPLYYLIFLNTQADVYVANDWFTMWMTGFFKIQNGVAIINDVPDRTNNLLDKIKLYFDRKYCKQIKKFFVLDINNKHKLLRWLGEDLKRSTYIVRSGIDISLYRSFKDTFDARTKLHFKKLDYIFVCANLMARHRRYDEVMKAFAQLKEKYSNIHLLILTKLDFDKSYANEITKLQDNLKIGSSVHIVDKYFTTEERMNYIHQSNVLIFPNYPQTWGLTVLEAMALGVPAIISTGCGVSEVLKNKINVVKYAKGNIDRLRDAMEYSLINKNDIQKIAKNGQKFVWTTLTWDKYGSKFINILNTLL